MTKYLVLIYGDEKAWADAPESWQQANMERHGAFIASAGTAIIGGDELVPSAKAVSLRTNGQGRVVATDGPFVETKEGIGGYYLLQAADMAEAIRLAGQIPEVSEKHSGVEIRAIAG